MTVRTADACAAARRATDGLPVVETAEGLVVPPGSAGGAALVFTG
jgi:hypothetical protein